jgi:putative ABC transport system permease protein
MMILCQDLRYGLRMLARNPGFSVTMIAILALGIGVNTAILSVVDAVLFKALPYCDEPDRVVDISYQAKALGMGRQRFNTSEWSLAYWREHNHVFEHIAGEHYAPAYVTGLEKPGDLSGFAVSPCYFAVAGIPPALGRGFLPEEESPGQERVIVLSHPLWQNRLGGDPQALGKTLTLNGRSHTIVGVMPPRFSGSRESFWVPLVPNPDDQGPGIHVEARLKRGVTLKQAQAEMDVLQAQLAQMAPEAVGGKTVVVRSLADMRAADYRTQLHLLWGAAGLVLLGACANAGSLFLVHANVCAPEIAVRAMLGAPRRRLVRQLLTQGVLLSTAAAGLGVLVGSWALQGFLRICPPDVPRIGDARLDRSALLLALGLAVLTGILLSLVPAWQVSGFRLYEATKGKATGPSLRSRAGRFQAGLIVAQIGIALTLLMGVGTLVQSLLSLRRVDLGFEPKDVVIASLNLPNKRYPQEYQWRAFFQQLLPRVQGLPGVRSAVLVCPHFDMSLGGGFTVFSIKGRPPESNEERPMTRVQIVGPDFCKTLGMRIVKGRDFMDRDFRAGGRSVIINEALARRYFATVDPLGECLDGLLPDEMPIVGVVQTLKDYRELEPDINTIYVPMAEDGLTCFAVMDLIVRTQGDCAPLIAALRAQIAALDAGLDAPIAPLETTLSDMLSTERFSALLLGLFAQMALALAAVGLYGSVQYAVTQHTHEIGIRMALGASRSSVVQAVLRQGVRLVLAGAALGLLGGYAVGRIMTSLLYQSKPTDLIVIAAAAATLLVVTAAACYLPARRAARIDPMVALRYE